MYDIYICLRVYVRVCLKRTYILNVFNKVFIAWQLSNNAFPSTNQAKYNCALQIRWIKNSFRRL